MIFWFSSSLIKFNRSFNSVRQVKIQDHDNINRKLFFLRRRYAPNFSGYRQEKVNIFPSKKRLLRNITELIKKKIIKNGEDLVKNEKAFVELNYHIY